MSSLFDLNKTLFSNDFLTLTVKNKAAFLTLSDFYMMVSGLKNQLLLGLLIWKRGM